MRTQLAASRSAQHAAPLLGKRRALPTDAEGGNPSAEHEAHEDTKRRCRELLARAAEELQQARHPYPYPCPCPYPYPYSYP